MNNQVITLIYLRKFSVNCKFVIILTQRTCNIIYMILWSILFTKNSYVMICSIHGRSHKICCTGINTDIFLVNVFLMNSFGNKMSIWCQHESSKLCINRYISHSCRNKYLIKFLMNSFTYYSYIIRCTFWIIRYTYST